MRFLPLTTGIASLALAATATAQGATYDVYGHGCNGGTPSTCITQNDMNVVLVGTTLPNEYAHAVTNGTGSVQYITGFDIFTGSTTAAPANIQIGFYRDSSGAGATTHTSPSPTAEALGTMDIDVAQTWYSGDINPPVVLAVGETAWISADTNDAFPPDNSNGVGGPAPSYWRRPPYQQGNAWSVTGIVNNPVYRLHCAGGSSDIAVLSNTGVPQIGNSMTLDVTRAQPNLAMFFVYSYDNTQWLGMPTPVDLGFVGAPNCLNYTATDVADLWVAGPNGAVSVTVTIPNNPGLAGLTFYNQVANVNPLAGNALNMGVTNAGTGVINP